MSSGIPPGNSFSDDEWFEKIWHSLSPEEQEAFNRSMAPLQEAAAKSLDGIIKDNMIAQFDVPKLHLDYQTLFPDLSDLGASTFEAIQPAFEELLESQREAFSELFADIPVSLDSLLPPNWRGEDVPLPYNIEELLLDEGLPLGWVPPKDVLIRIFSADTPEERQQILELNSDFIARACRTQLESIEDPDLQEHVQFARESVDTLSAGSEKASQALSTNLLDTILRHSLNKYHSHGSVTRQKNRPNIDDYPVRVAIVIGGIWGAHSEYWPANGDEIPRRYSRHASAHGVSFRQYSRLNALIALMHVVGLLKVLEHDFR